MTEVRNTTLLVPPSLLPSTSLPPSMQWRPLAPVALLGNSASGVEREVNPTRPVAILVCILGAAFSFLFYLKWRDRQLQRLRWRADSDNAPARSVSLLATPQSRSTSLVSSQESLPMERPRKSVHFNEVVLYASSSSDKAKHEGSKSSVVSQSSAASSVELFHVGSGGEAGAAEARAELVAQGGVEGRPSGAAMANGNGTDEIVVASKANPDTSPTSVLSSGRTVRDAADYFTRKMLKPPEVAPADGSFQANPGSFLAAELARASFSPLVNEAQAKAGQQADSDARGAYASGAASLRRSLLQASAEGRGGAPPVGVNAGGGRSGCDNTHGSNDAAACSSTAPAFQNEERSRALSVGDWYGESGGSRRKQSLFDWYGDDNQEGDGDEPVGGAQMFHLASGKTPNCGLERTISAHYQQRGVSAVMDSFEEVAHGEGASSASGISKNEPNGVQEEDRLSEMISRSRKLLYRMPDGYKRIAGLCESSRLTREEAVQFAESTRPIVHPRFIDLAIGFLNLKREHGSDVERTFYAGLDIFKFISRLLRKRPLSFFQEDDLFLLRDGETKGAGGDGPLRFEDIGTAIEQPPLTLEHYQSYDEMELSALIGISGSTAFINSGDHEPTPPGKPASDRLFEDRGIAMGLVGSRFDKESRMDCKHMHITEQNSVTENGYGHNGDTKDPLLKLWANFYGFSHFPTYAEAQEDLAAQGRRFVKMRHRIGLFDTQVYAARCEIIAELFLAEANARARDAGAIAFCHIVGLGLGDQQLDDCQPQIQVNAYATAIQKMALPSLGWLNFSRFGRDERSQYWCGTLVNGGDLRDRDGNAIRVVFNDRDVADALPPLPKGHRPWLLVAQYSWNANSYPGNEYWDGQLDASDGAAMAACTLTPELQNPDVNQEAFQPSRVYVVATDAVTLPTESQ